MSLLGNERIILVGGPGGVGKTTLAASIGIHLAMEGHKTIVLTVDPARRLAGALGFSHFSSDLQSVPLPPEAKGTLAATMLDARRYFDKIIDRFARSREQKEKILNNPIYRTMVESLGGTHEYAAMERLFEFASDSSYDRIVVDTPPTQNALDLLDAPQRLADFMDNSVLKWFQGPKPIYLRLFQTGTKVAMKLLQKVFGGDFLAAFGTLMDDIEGMQAGFRSRNLEVLQLLQSQESAFLLVTFASEARFLESVAFWKTLQTKQIRLKGIVLNRTEPVCEGESKDFGPLDGPTREAVSAWLQYQKELYTQQQRWIASFEAALPGVTTRCVPRRSDWLTDIGALSRLGQYLLT